MSKTAVQVESKVTSSQQCSIEYLTLKSCTCLLTSSITEAPLEVAGRCFERSLISQSLYQSVQNSTRDNSVKASDIVVAVITKVQHFPKKYGDFMAVLKVLPVMHQLAETVNEKYEELGKSAKDRPHDGKLKIQGNFNFM